MGHLKYQHVERIGSDETNGIEIGKWFNMEIKTKFKIMKKPKEKYHFIGSKIIQRTPENCEIKNYLQNYCSRF